MIIWINHQNWDLSVCTLFSFNEIKSLMLTAAGSWWSGMDQNHTLLSGLLMVSWKALVKTYALLLLWAFPFLLVQYSAGDGDNTYFSKDWWVRSRTLCELFPQLYHLHQKRLSSVASVLISTKPSPHFLWIFTDQLLIVSLWRWCALYICSLFSFLLFSFNDKPCSWRKNERTQARAERKA